MPASPTATATVKETSVVLPVHRLDIETYNKIVASGALEGQRVELLDGVLVEMSPHSPAHGTLIERLTSHFAATGMALRVQLPIEVGPDSEPEPDLALLAERPAPTEHPRTALLVVEVAVSSQKTDRDTKGALYARAAIPTYWLVDVPARAIEVYTEPGDGGYGARELISGKDKLRCALAGVTDIDLALLFEGIEG